MLDSNLGPLPQQSRAASRVRIPASHEIYVVHKGWQLALCLSPCISFISAKHTFSLSACLSAPVSSSPCLLTYRTPCLSVLLSLCPLYPYLSHRLPPRSLSLLSSPSLTSSQFQRMFFPASLSSYLFVSLPICLPVSLPICLPASLRVHASLSPWLFVSLSPYLSVCLPASLRVHCSCLSVTLAHPRSFHLFLLHQQGVSASLPHYLYLFSLVQLLCYVTAFYAVF